MRTRAKKRLIRQLVMISIFGAALVLFWIFLRYITTDHVAPSDSGAILHVTASRS
jgi:ABC-type bacteriocin/lantibiotic exporter with double-glycine peptidase domain